MIEYTPGRVAGARSDRASARECALRPAAPDRLPRAYCLQKMLTARHERRRISWWPMAMHRPRRPLAVLACAGAIIVAAGTLRARPVQTDLDALMADVLARRDDNWAKLQQYVLDERDAFDLRGPGGVPLWGERRDYTWYIRDGFFVRSPISVNGARVSDADRAKAEAAYLEGVKRHDREDREKQQPGDDAAVASDATPHATRDASGLDMSGLLTETRRPGFVDAAYFLRFKFEPGRYAFVGRETLDGRTVLRIEYYPTALFRDGERGKRDAGHDDRSAEDRRSDETMTRLMNKVSLVTLWVEPTARQVLKYTFDNINMDFLPAAWLVRIDDLHASMRMSEPFPNVWLPAGIDMTFRALTAAGPVSARYRVDYDDYRQATTSGRILPPAR